MLRNLLAIVGLGLWGATAFAADAGKIIFVAGQVKVADRAAELNGVVREGDMLVTGGDGYVYVKTIDNGLFIVRPSSKARIVNYHIDAANPANTRIKLELLEGVARSQSGEAVKQARQNFRFNTPVAAIGVRGTDFAVSADQEVTRVTVLSGGITISGFAGACSPDGTGPCEGKASRELSAAQRGLLLQVRRGQAAPQLLPSGTLAPDVVAPPRTDEPKGGMAGGPPEPSLEAKKDQELKQRVAQVVQQPPTTTPDPIVTVPPVLEKPDTGGGVVVVPPVVTPPVVDPPVVTPPEPPQPERKIVWGRWQPLLDKTAKVDLVAMLKSGAELVDMKGNFALFRTPGADYQIPERSSAGFTLKDSEAYILRDSFTPAEVAKVENGVLNFNFDQKTYTTSFDLVAQAERFNMRSSGTVGSDGRFYGESPRYNNNSNVNVTGVLSSENGGTAAYLFQGRLDAARTTEGATYWTKPK